jgi:hypothetical protein
MTTTSLPHPGMMTRARTALAAFVSAPASPRPLGCLRIGLAAVLLLQALAIAPSVLDLFGLPGIVQWQLGEQMIYPGVPRLRWLAEALAPLGVSPAACVRAVFILYVAGLAALLSGWHTRLAAALTYVTHLLLFMSTRASVYGVDDFTNIALFYFMWMPVGHWLSLDCAAGRASSEPTSVARLALRVFQIHLCLVYTSSGIEKALTPPYQWLDGEAIWRTLVIPEYEHFHLTWLAYVPWLVVLAAWSTLIVEIGYGLFVWPRRTRKAWGLATLGMHMGIGVFMGLVSFAAVMMVFTASMFLVSAEPAPALRSAP